MSDMDKTISDLQSYMQQPHDVNDLLPHERMLFQALLRGCVSLQLRDSEIVSMLQRLTTLCQQTLEDYARRRE